VLEITGCWANLHSPGAAHRAHSHPNNYLSAVYYVRTWPGADTINFHDPRSQAGVIRPPVTELTAIDSRLRSSATVSGCTSASRLPHGQ
jgi:uncharacterized protein (TIGR02466 family)